MTTRPSIHVCVRAQPVKHYDPAQSMHARRTGIYTTHQGCRRASIWQRVEPGDAHEKFHLFPKHQILTKIPTVRTRVLARSSVKNRALT